MSINKFELLFGILLVLLPFLGFPALVKTIAYVVIGVFLIIFSIIRHVQRRSSPFSASEESQEASFIEHHPATQDENEVVHIKITEEV